MLDRASRGWRELAYTPTATRHLQDLRRDLFTPPTTKVITEPVTTAAQHPTGSQARQLFHHQWDATPGVRSLPRGQPKPMTSEALVRTCQQSAINEAS